MKRKISELLKSLAIVALAVNAVFLAYKSEVFNEFLAEAKLPAKLAAYFQSGKQPGGIGNTAGENGEAGMLAKPVCMAVVSDVGARYGAKYDAEQLTDVYEKTVNIFGEALGSAAVPEACGENEWRAALARPGIYWDYQVELPIASLVKWLGMSALNANSDYASRFAVVIGESGDVIVYYANSDGCYRCGTAAAADSLGGVLLEFLPNGAYFAFESEDVGKMVEPYTLVMPEVSSKYVLSAENIIGREDIRERTAELLGMNILGGASYLEKNGTMVFVGVSGILRIHPDGEVNYSATDYDYTADNADGVSDEQIIERAYALVSGLRAGCSGSETMYFSGLEKSGDGRYVVSFSYFADGAMIVQRSGKAAAAVYEKGRLVSLDIWMRSYFQTEERATLLPELQAAAIAGGLQKNGSLKLVYYDDGGGTVQPAWTVE
ncbi:MAG: hypothetical protein PUB32_08205 [Clostridiales bacterium]|nr:hypothetical protein [Clostridiales bacterium]